MRKILGGSLRDGVNGVIEVSRPSVAMEIAYRQLITQSSVWNSNIGRFVRTSATAKTWFQCEKAVKRWHGPNDSAKKQKEAMQAD